MIEGEKHPTISILGPIIYWIFISLQSITIPFHVPVQEMKKTLLDGIVNRFEYIWKDYNLLISSFLDPEINNLSNLNQQEQFNLDISFWYI